MEDEEKERLLRELGSSVINRIAAKYSVKSEQTEERLKRLIAILPLDEVKKEYENYIDCRLKTHFLYSLSPDQLNLAKENFEKFLEKHDLNDFLYSSPKKSTKKKPQLVSLKQMEDGRVKLYYTYTEESSDWDYVKHKIRTTQITLLAIALIEPETGLLCIRITSIGQRRIADEIFEKLKQEFANGEGEKLKFEKNHLLTLLDWSEQRRYATILPVLDDAEKQSILNDKKYRAKKGKDMYESKRIKEEIKRGLKGSIYVTKTLEKSSLGFGTNKGHARLSFRGIIGERAINYVLMYIKQILEIS